MKHFYTLLILVFGFTKSFSKTVDGYIVTLNDDTSFVKIKLPGFVSTINLNREVVVIDSSGESKTLTPKDIKAFGYSENQKQYRFVAKPIKNGTIYFLIAVIVGQKASLYFYSSQAFSNASVQQFFTFEKPDDKYLFMTNYDQLDQFKEKLKSFYNDNPQIQTFIDTKFSSGRHIQRDIQEVVNAVNNL